MSNIRPPAGRTKSPQPTFNPRRLRAALDLRGSSIEAVARDAQISPRHVRYFLSGERRASSRLLDAIRAALGDAGWAFATGQADALREEASPNATA